jgi:hypothetical protein
VIGVTGAVMFPHWLHQLSHLRQIVHIRKNITYVIDLYVIYIHTNKPYTDGMAHECAFAAAGHRLLHKVVHRRGFFGGNSRQSGFSIASRPCRLPPFPHPR